MRDEGGGKDVSKGGKSGQKGAKGDTEHVTTRLAYHAGTSQVAFQGHMTWNLDHVACAPVPPRCLLPFPSLPKYIASTRALESTMTHPAPPLSVSPLDHLARLRTIGARESATVLALGKEVLLEDAAPGEEGGFGVRANGIEGIADEPSGGQNGRSESRWPSPRSTWGTSSSPRCVQPPFAPRVEH